TLFRSVIDLGHGHVEAVLDLFFHPAEDVTLALQRVDLTEVQLHETERDLDHGCRLDVSRLERPGDLLGRVELQDVADLNVEVTNADPAVLPLDDLAGVILEPI